MSLVPYRQEEGGALVVKAPQAAAQLQEKKKNANQDMPIVCASCLGVNPFLKMIRHTLSEECKTCKRVYTVYTWKRERGTRYMKTIICAVCATMKNLCQCCLVDLEFGLPVHLRDAAHLNSTTAKSGDDLGNRLRAIGSRRSANDSQEPEVLFNNPVPNTATVTLVYEAEMAERAIRDGGENSYLLQKKRALAPHELLRKVRQQPYSMKNKIKGLKPPEDTSIRTLYIGNIDPLRIQEEDLKPQLESHGTIKSLKMIAKEQCALVTFVRREDAEAAANALHKRFLVKGMALKLLWAKPRIDKRKKQAADIAQQAEKEQQLAALGEHMNKHQWLALREQQEREMQEAGVVPPPFLIPPSGFELAPPPSEDQPVNYAAMQYGGL